MRRLCFALQGVLENLPERKNRAAHKLPEKNLHERKDSKNIPEKPGNIALSPLPERFSPDSDFTPSVLKREFFQRILRLSFLPGRIQEVSTNTAIE